MVIRHADQNGTERYRARFLNQVHENHFCLANELWFPSIGLGLYSKPPSAHSSADRMREAVYEALQSGCNHIDAAVKGQSQNNEQVIGQALASSIAMQYVSRDEIIVASRGGYVQFEGEYPVDAERYVRTRLFEAGIATDEFAQGGHHCMSPKFLRMQLRNSLTNLGLGTLDIYYIHYPEVQRAERGEAIFESRLLAAFAELEAQIRSERLVNYGVATIDGLRVSPDDRAYLSLERLVQLARDAGGPNHHFRYVQAPFNVAMRELGEFKNQICMDRTMTVLEAAKRLEIAVIGNSTLWQGQLTRHLPLDFQQIGAGTRTKAQAAIQFARSTPGFACTLVGMSQIAHIHENLELTSFPMLSREQCERLLRY